MTCGASHSWEIAMIKALSEYVERIGSDSLREISTTGFAAFPFLFRKERARTKARENAFFEMAERYAWPEWFYSPSISYQLKNTITRSNESLYQAICNEIKISRLYTIYPKFKNSDLKMAILYAVTEYGLVCGGAVRHSEAQAEQNALKELYMHAVGLYRMKTHQIHPTTDYEKRVIWISRQEELLKKRLFESGAQLIDIPFPIIFHDVNTKFNQAYVVQRCLFKGYDKKFISQENEIYV